MTQLNEEQISKFRALGTAARNLGNQYKEGKGPDPQSGATFKNGQPWCTWGQLLDQAGFKTTSSTGDNLGSLNAFLTGSFSHTVVSGPTVEAVKDGLIVSKTKKYDISKIKSAAQSIMGANDPCRTPEERKARTHKLLLNLADEIDAQFGQPEQEESMYYSTAAEQVLENLILGNE